MALNVIELRIGSWVEYQNNYYQVISIERDKIGITRDEDLTKTTLEVAPSQLNGIQFNTEILRNLNGYISKDTETLSNCYLVSLREITQKGNTIDWSLSFRELEGSWWVNVEESSVTFETIGEGEFYYLHDLQNIISSLIYCDIIWKKNSI